MTGFARMGELGEVLGVFREMWVDGVRPNRFTLSCVLKCCAGLKEFDVGEGVHGWLLRNWVDVDIVLGNSLVDLYAKSGKLEYARAVFESMPEKDIVSCNIMIGLYVDTRDLDESIDLFRKMACRDVASWNSIISGLLRNGCNRLALELLYEMVELGNVFSEVTFSIALILAGSLSFLELGEQMHCKILKIGFDRNRIVRSSLIDMYCKCGEMEMAVKVLGAIKPQALHSSVSGMLDATISWSSIVSGYVQNGSIECAFELFRRMIREGVEVNQVTLTSMTLACAGSGIIEQGRQIHALIEKQGHKPDNFLLSAIVDMYAKCGSLDDALSTFYQTTSRNTVLWTSVISACALHGQGEEAIQLFQQMLNERITPNEVTFLSILSGCGRSGLVEEGCAYFRSMQEDYGIVPRMEHFTCIVDLLGRAGLLEKAKEFIYENGISDQMGVWRAFLSACKVYKNIGLAKWASDQLLKLEPRNESSYVLLSNICATSNKWMDAAEMRTLMQKRGIKKRPGVSWIRLKNKIHTFFAGDISHPQAGEIYSYLETLIVRLKEVGYSSDTSLITHDVEEEQREIFLGFHSEKLAIAFGIMSTPSGSPILVLKNIRICVDCHTAIKYISLVTDRKITVRDTLRFHHFESGHCSCKDYW
ncbi:hypothetical protein Sjap_009548 [Stephania japonica]|uniref:DYW domain-containing protein n=1 Tax=Stephania japonica TaxID=461633 RepID=A0AAP0PDE8_9MAGN